MTIPSLLTHTMASFLEALVRLLVYLKLISINKKPLDLQDMPILEVKDTPAPLTPKQKREREKKLRKEAKREKTRGLRVLLAFPDDLSDELVRQEEIDERENQDDVIENSRQETPVATRIFPLDVIESEIFITSTASAVISKQTDDVPLSSNFRVCNKILPEPLCYREPSLRVLISEVDDLIYEAGFISFVFGSAIYKYRTKPGDVDFIVPHITSLDDIKKIINAFKAHDVSILGWNIEEGMEGYRRNNRYVLPIQWKQGLIEYPVDIILYHGSIEEHAKSLDITLGAIYFQPRLKNMYELPELNSIEDLQDQKIRTISDATLTFKKDLTILFRNIRLKQLEIFYFDASFIDAAKSLATEPNNLFSDITRSILRRQLDSLFEASPERLYDLMESEEDIQEYKIEMSNANLHDFAELGLLDKLSQRLNVEEDKLSLIKYADRFAAYEVRCEALLDRKKRVRSPQARGVSATVLHFIRHKPVACEAQTVLKNTMFNENKKGQQPYLKGIKNTSVGHRSCIHPRSFFNQALAETTKTEHKLHDMTCWGDTDKLVLKPTLS